MGLQKHDLLYAFDAEQNPSYLMPLFIASGLRLRAYELA